MSENEDDDYESRNAEIENGHISLSDTNLTDDSSGKCYFG